MEHAAFLDMYNQYLLESIYREMDDNPAIKSDDDALQFLQKRLGEKTSGFTEELIRCRFYLEMLPKRTDRYPEQIHRAGTIRQRLHARKNAGRQRRTERCVERRTRRRNATDRTRLDDPREPVSNRSSPTTRARSFTSISGHRGADRAWPKCRSRWNYSNTTRIRTSFSYSSADNARTISGAGRFSPKS